MASLPPAAVASNGSLGSLLGPKAASKDSPHTEVKVSVLSEAELSDGVGSMAIEARGNEWPRSQTCGAEDGISGAMSVVPNQERHQETPQAHQQALIDPSSSRAMVEVAVAATTSPAVQQHQQQADNWLGGRDGLVHQAEELLRSGISTLMLCGGPGHGKSTAAQVMAALNHDDEWTSQQ